VVASFPAPLNFIFFFARSKREYCSRKERMRAPTNIRSRRAKRKWSFLCSVASAFLALLSNAQQKEKNFSAVKIIEKKEKVNRKGVKEKKRKKKE
jgi:hypothetical protein